MSANELLTVAGLLITITAGIGAWMFKVHAKLAVIASKLVDVAERLERSADDRHELWNVYMRHETRLERHEAELKHLTEQLRDA